MIIVSHGFPKKGQKTKARDRDAAIAAYHAYFEGKRAGRNKLLQEEPE